MRSISFAPNEYYHLCNRSIGGDTLFLDTADYARFLFLIFYFQSSTPFSSLSFHIDRFLKSGSFGVSAEKLRKWSEDRQLELMSFALMGNHFHLLVRNLEDDAVSIYMHRVLMAYSKYFNAKYHKRGHVFQGPFSATHIKDNTQLLHASCYVHKNPRDIAEWRDSYFQYPYSSLGDYIKESRWGELLKPEIILNQFKTSDEYRKFIQTSTAKEYGLFEEVLKKSLE